jgi:hypothetical protein
MSLLEILLTLWLIFILLVFVIFYRKYKYINDKEEGNDIYLTEEHRELLRRRNESVRD